MAAISKIQVEDSIDHLFRHHAGQMVSVLCRLFGFERIDMIEDAVQDSMIAALRKWPFAGMPENPTAWLTQTAKNRLIDKLRRDNRSQSSDEDFDIADPSDALPVFFSSELSEDQLRMIFACCHPSIPPDSQVALTLKIVGGFSVAEIAAAYLANEETVAKLLTRAKSRLRSAGVSLEIPSGIELSERLDAVLRVLYLMFNEGYSASGGHALIRTDLCFEAVRLAEKTAQHPVTGSPKVHALASLFLFQAARLSTRTDSSGELLLLADQNRSMWNAEMLARGLEHFRLSATGDELSDYHIEAEIASLHALAPDYESTDWRRILEGYDLLLSRRFSPVVALNRVVCIGEIFGSMRALDDLSGLAENYLMTSFNLFHVTRGHFLAEVNQTSGALASYERALKLTSNETVKRFISGKIEMLKSAS